MILLSKSWNALCRLGLSMFKGFEINFCPLVSTCASAEVKILLLKLRTEVGLRATGGYSLNTSPMWPASGLQLSYSSGPGLWIHPCLCADGSRLLEGGP